MANKGMMTGMRGVYLVAAELTKLGWVVAPTSRSAIGADLLVTDNTCSRAWSVQVKTNSKPGTHWLLSKNAGKIKSDSHMYVFVDLMPNDERPGFYIVPSRTVAEKTREVKNSTGTVWYRFDKHEVQPDDWRAFGRPESEDEIEG